MTIDDAKHPTVKRFAATSLPVTNRCVKITADPEDDPVLRQSVRDLARRLNLPTTESTGSDSGILLAVTPQRLELRINGEQRTRPVWVDFSKLDTSSPAGRSSRQPLAKAVGLRKLGRGSHVVDATAGWGEDAWLFASLGYRVTAVERSPVVAALLADGLERARRVKPEVAGRISLVVGDACDVLAGIKPRPDVVYLDPMFPARRSSALERIAMRVLRAVVGDDDDAPGLFEVARGVANRRVVVKRPLRAEPLAPDPVATHKGKGVRYDVYPITAKP